MKMAMAKKKPDSAPSAEKKPTKTTKPRAKKVAAPTPPTPDDPVTAFAKEVVQGVRIAGPHVRNACLRHLKDLETGAERGLVWNFEKAQLTFDFFEKVLRLNGGDFEGRPFLLLPWQKFVVGSLFGWYGADGFRRFRVAYIETAKGSGKSPLAAGIGLKGLVADGEPRAEVYSVAAKKDQAMVLFRDAVAMTDQSPLLAKNLVKSGTGEKCWNLAYMKEGAFFRTLSSDKKQSGSRPHIGLVDELHEHQDGNAVEMMNAGTKSRRQALILMITNAGSGRGSMCWEKHLYAEKIAAGALPDDAFFSFVCSLDEADDPFHDEKCWAKANPSLQDADLPGVKYIRAQVTEARGMPSKESVVRRLNFCQWTEAESPWISGEIWREAQSDYTVEDLRGRRVYGALDLSSNVDLTAMVFAVEPVEEGEPWKLLPFCWLPEEGLARKAESDRVPYDTWERDGYLSTTSGRAVSKLAVIQQLSAWCDYFEVMAIAYDRWRIKDFISMADDAGITLPPMVEFGQGFKDFSPAVSDFEQMLLNGHLQHNGHMVLDWCMSNAVIESDAAENRKLSKSKARGRIDVAVAAVMAVGLIHKSDASDDQRYEVLDDDFTVFVAG